MYKISLMLNIALIVALIELGMAYFIIRWNIRRAYANMTQIDTTTKHNEHKKKSEERLRKMFDRLDKIKDYHTIALDNSDMIEDLKEPVLEYCDLIKENQNMYLDYYKEFHTIEEYNKTSMIWSAEYKTIVEPALAYFNAT